MQDCLLKIVVIVFAFILAGNVKAQIGRVGINTTSPQAMLHVSDSSVVFTAPYDLPENPPGPPVSGNGVRMMWYAEKAAFKAGQVSGYQWDEEYIGTCSASFGKGTVCSGRSSFAAGFNATATGEGAIAMGGSTIASALTSVAMGNGTNASGTAATAFGGSTKASGNYSTALGYESKAIGERSLATGYFTSASGVSSASFNNVTAATGHYSIAMGSFTTASGELAVAMGIGSHAKSYSSLVLGKYNDTTSISSNNWIAEDPLLVLGNGSASHLRGNAFTVLKNSKVGIGIPNPGFPLNFRNDLGDKISLFSNNGPHYGFGIQNSLLQIHSDVVGSDIAFGYGTSAAFTETMRIKGNGKLGINTITPDAMVHILRGGPSGGGYGSNSSMIIESDQHSFIQFSNNNDEECGLLSGTQATIVRSGIVFTADSSIHFRTGGNFTKINIDKNGNTGLGIIPGYQLHLASNSAAKPTSNVWTVASDARLKKDVHNYEDGLEELLKIRPVWFTYNGEAGMPMETGVGVVAQELKEVAPYMVGSWNYKDETGNTTPYLSVDNGSMTYMLINAVKEQQVTIDKLQEQIDVIMQELKEMRKDQRNVSMTEASK